MAINKVEFDGQTLIDLTGDTVTQQDVLNGKSFHTPDGVQRSGTASIPVSDVTVDGTSVVTNGVAEVVTDNLAPTVTEASSRTNLAVGDSLKTIIGKIKKFFSDLKTVAFTGSYNDLSNKPTIPSAQVNSDWNANSGVAQILNKPSLATVATSGKSSDLNNDAGFITNTVNNLANYYLKSETYTQAEVNALIGAITTIHFEVVQTLPTSDIQTNVIYLVPKSTAGTNDVYDEYINTTGTSAGWELIGSTQVDLSNYYTKTQTDTLLAGKVSDVEVNGSSVVNSSHVAEITSYEEVTIAQYNALPASKKNCGIAYFIKDLDSASVEGYPPLIYSLEEREVGVWTDGKPLYQRTFVYTPSSTISTTTVIANLSSEIEVKDIKGVAVNSQNDRVLPLCYAGNHFGTNFGTSASNDLQIEIYGDTWGTNYTFLATIQYTKTTDTAGSGIWNGQGGLAHHYSTSEKVIGTWIDGKPLYEITYSITTPSTENQVTIIQDITSLNIDSIADIKGMIDNIPINWTQGDANLSACWINGTKTGIAMKVGNSSLTSKSCNVTIQYTKTTD